MSLILVYRSSVEAATGGVLSEKVFIEISQNSQENTCDRVSFLIKFAKCIKMFLIKFAKCIKKSKWDIAKEWQTDIAKVNVTK